MDMGPPVSSAFGLCRGGGKLRTSHSSGPGGSLLRTHPRGPAMSNLPSTTTLDEAKVHVARTACGGCQKTGLLAAYLVQKDGPNHGRLFAKCRHCGYFAWLSAATERDEEVERAEAGARPCPKCAKA